MMVTTMQDLLDIKEAAALLRVSETSLRRWTNAGRLPCLRIGGRHERRFRRQDLEAFVAGTGHASSAGASEKHFCGFYESEESRVRDAAAFLASGMSHDTRCLLAVTAGVRESLLAALERVRPETRADLRDRRIVVSTYRRSAAAQIEFWRTEMRAALAAGVSRILTLGDVSAGPLGRMPLEQVLQYEADYGRFIADAFPVTTLCQYDARELSAVAAAALLRRHDGTHRTYRLQH
jgi:excisionase family DNA binding protein